MQINAQLSVLNSALSLPSNQRDTKIVATLQATVAQLRTQRDTFKREISRRFPDYAALIGSPLFHVGS